MRIVAVSPHPDDTEYGIGGILLLLRQKEHEIVILHNTKYDLHEEIVSDSHGLRMLDAERACALLGAECYYFSIDDSLKKLAHKIIEIQPDVLLLPAQNDYNIIHQKVHRSIKEAVEVARKLSADFNLKQLFYYETYSTYNFTSDYVCDISKVYSKALKLLKTHSIGIETLPSLPYKFQITHQLRGIECSCLYGEGLQMDNSPPYSWKDNRRYGLDFLRILL